MVQFRAVLAVLAVSVGFAFFDAPPAMAQPAGQDASSASGASTPKQIAKAQRKAARKAARMKKNAELKALEKNGFRTSGDQDNYPQNLQNAERKAAESNAVTAKPASGQ